MLKNTMIHISESNLSIAWSKAFDRLMEPGVFEISPLIVSVTGFSAQIPDEEPLIRQAMDHHLLATGQHGCETVASTIFPQSLWNPSKSRQHLYNRYEQIWPQIKRQGNTHGSYFKRLVAFGRPEAPINQLEHIIQAWNRQIHRRTALLASVFDPSLDHTFTKMRGFPCLQQVTFNLIDSDGLQITGFYPMQYVVERGYGNYLGLCRLGRFMAHAMRLKLKKMTCIANIAVLGNQGKRALGPLFRKVTPAINRYQTTIPLEISPVR